MLAYSRLPGGLDGRKLDHKTLEQDRIHVVRQVERGARPEYLAMVLGFARSTVFGWVARYREGGLEVFKARTIPGRPQKLSGPQLRQIYTLIVGNDPRQLSSEFALWTGEMVQELIRREFQRQTVGSERGAAASKAGIVIVASAMASPPTESRGSGAMEERRVSSHPC
jgi:transposase